MTLQELKNLPDEQLAALWHTAGFPFDFAVCGRCMTQHAYTRCDRHQELRLQAKPIRDRLLNYSGAELRKYLEEIYALRMFFKHFYPHTLEIEETSDKTSKEETHAPPT